MTLLLLVALALLAGVVLRRRLRAPDVPSLLFLLGFLGVFLILPLLTLLVVLFTGRPLSPLQLLAGPESAAEFLRAAGGAFGLDAVRDIAADPATRRAVVNTLVLGLAVTLTDLALALPIAWGLARGALPLRRTIESLSLLPLAVPTFIGAFAFVAVFGRSGWATHLSRALGLGGPLFDVYSGLGVYLVQVAFTFPYALLPAAASLSMADRALEEAAAVAGAPRAMVLLRTTLPLAAPGISAGALLVFGVVLEDFGTPAVISPKGFTTLPVEAYQQMLGFQRWGAAAGLSVLMVLLGAGLLLVQRRFLAGRAFATVSGHALPPVPPWRPGLAGFLLAGWSLAVLAVPIATLLTVLVYAVADGWGATALPEGFTLRHVAGVLERGSETLGSTFLLCAGATLLALPLALASGRLLARTRRGSRALDLLVYLPLLLPGTAYAIAVLQTYNLPLSSLGSWLPDRPLTASAAVLVIAYAVRRFPYAARTVQAAVAQVDPSLEEAAATLGAPRALVSRRVVAPLVRPGLAAGGVLVFLTAAREISATVVLAPPGWSPLSRAIFTEAREPDVFRAAALSVMLLAAVLVLQAVSRGILRGRGEVG